MDNPTSKVIKSKSSNSALTKCEKENQGRKKSKSSAEFQTLAVKKRGVYVENKRAKNLTGRETETKIDEIQPVKPPRRPKPGSKRFLDSVLTILAKSTTGTQHPDASENKRKIKKKTTKDPERIAKDPVEKEKKPKYRSKILNDNKNQLDKFEVIQSKKEIIQTPSIYSERSYREDIKWSDLPRLVKPEEETKVTVSNLVREVTEGKKIKEKKVTIEEPTTLVSEHKDDKRLYNFFVDLLETTFSVYNVKAEYTAPIASTVSSNIAFEIDESVARKLNVGTEMFEDKTKKPEYCIKNDNWNDDNLIDYFQSTTKRNEVPLKSPKRRIEPFVFNRSKIPLPKSKSVSHRKSFYRKNKKEDLLNILKEQLMMDRVSFEEPQNLYQALKVMAKNKRKQKTIRFEAKTKPGYKPPECMLKRRKVISPSTKSTKYESDVRSNRSISQKFSELSGYRQDVDEISNHSLEVYGFDYEVPYRKKEKRREMLMTYHSSEESETEDILKFNDSSSTIRDFTNSIELC